MSELKVELLRQTVRRQIWEHVEPSLNGYSKLISMLLNRMTLYELMEILDNLKPKED